MADVSRQDIAKAEKRVMSPTDAKEDMMLVLGPHMNWQEMLCPAPLSVCLLGQLVLVTLDKDVSLVSEHMDRSAFKYTKYPDSLRTSIVQVANQGWTSFNCANKNMDQIRLLTLQIPLHVKNAVKFNRKQNLIQGEESRIERIERRMKAVQPPPGPTNRSQGRREGYPEDQRRLKAKLKDRDVDDWV
ncbi:uncharacterized protein LOC124268492 [Haliotis rubra]|uniref:uncharacterized protein LOC124268492 n=1 Tax=Haliotis rubra TaxID=36100 RepID=UPI001EE59422|nr:uncharacterized protein LOC124268492 [Haliotis rubra]